MMLCRGLTITPSSTSTPCPEAPPSLLTSSELGVVVLSDDFLTSKWPMLELERLVLHEREKGSEAIVFPLFYKLRPVDLKSPEKLLKWRGMWTEMDSERADKWEKAVKALSSFSGEIFAQDASEAAYIKRVVRLICNLVSSPILCDLSHIQGHQRLAQEVASQFREQCDNVCMVGLYGVGGLGKTTMCQIMSNFYTSRLYPGKCCHIEFPSDGDDEKIMQECTKALKQLANLSDDHLLNKVDRFDQVIHLMREHLRGYDVFLAIDNVWESSLNKAKRILGVSFSPNSKILLTSRSEEVLKDLLRGHSNTTIVPLPSPDQHEGFQIFQDSFELGDLNSLLVNRNLLDRVLKRCFFSGNYHALALKALGRYVKRACVPESLDKIEHILQEIDNSIALQTVEELIRLNYVNLAADKKHMFLDIVVTMMVYRQVKYKEAHQWLSFLYSKYSKATITYLIHELALDGLIQIENIDDKSAEKMIGVHDLYFALAEREAATSVRFFTDGSATSVEEVEWEKLERVILSNKHDDSPRFIEELLKRKCRKLQVLHAKGIDFRSGIHLDLMPSLCVLTLRGGTLRSIKDWSASKGLAVVHLSDLECAPPLTAIPSIPRLEELIIEDVESVEGPPSLHHGGQHLKRLVLDGESVFKESCKASYFNSLTNLESLTICHFNSITRVLNLNALIKLQFLCVRKCESIKRIEGLDALKNLQMLEVYKCPCFSNLDGMSGLLHLADVTVEWCGAFKTMPDLRGLTCLEWLGLWYNESMEEVVAGGLSPALKRVVVTNCGALKTMPDLSGLTRLERLQLQCNESMEVVAGGLSPALKHVQVTYCGALKTMPDLSGLTCLESLELCFNKSMEEVGGENLSPSLLSLSICHCRSLRRFPKCGHLRELTASACFFNNENIGPCIESIINLPNLQKLCLWMGERTSIERLISASFLENLQELELQVGDEWTSMNERLISGAPHLQRLSIGYIGSQLLKLDVGCLPSNLKRLELSCCHALEEIGGDLSALHSLETLELSFCPRLKKLGALPHHLQSLTLLNCESLEESSVPGVSLIPVVTIGSCPKL